MQKREKILAAVVGLLVLTLGLRYVYSGVEARFDQRIQQREVLRQEIDRKNLIVLKGRRAAQQIVDFESRSLPPDLEHARSLYQNWLVSLVEKSGIRGGVSSQASSSRAATFQRLGFAVTGEGTLAQVVQLLYDFYSVDRLQQIRLLSLRPQTDGKRVDLVLSIEALTLPGAAETAGVNPVAAERLSLGSLAAYQQPIVDRNFFAAYVPPPPPKPTPRPQPPAKPVVRRPEPPKFDPAKYTVVSAILKQGEKPQVWFNNQTTGNVLRLFEGSEFEVGAVQGTIHKIGLREVEIHINGERRLLGLGENLHEGALLPDGDL